MILWKVLYQLDHVIEQTQMIPEISVLERDAVWNLWEASHRWITVVSCGIWEQVSTIIFKDFFPLKVSSWYWTLVETVYLTMDQNYHVIWAALHDMGVIWPTDLFSRTSVAAITLQQCVLLNKHCICVTGSEQVLHVKAGYMKKLPKCLLFIPPWYSHLLPSMYL